MPTKVRFLQDFRGVETNEAYYAKGTVTELEDNIADRLLADGRVEHAGGRGVRSHGNTPQMGEVEQAPDTDPAAEQQPAEAVTAGEGQSTDAADQQPKNKKRGGK